MTLSSHSPVSDPVVNGPSITQKIVGMPASDGAGVKLTRGNHMQISTGRGGKFLLIAGKPLKEPVAQGGLL
ncbi:MAG: hypothetical protein AAGE59_02770 [Cyanobacteria bacterium P01_F01_bin.86]